MLVLKSEKKMKVGKIKENERKEEGNKRRKKRSKEREIIAATVMVRRCSLF